MVGASAGQFGRINSAPTFVVNPANLRSCNICRRPGPPGRQRRYFLRDLLRDLLRLNAIGRDGARRPALGPPNHVKPVVDLAA